MAIHIRRRAFISLLGGAAAWPVAARAQQAAMPVIGFLHARLPEDTMYQVAAFRSGLAEIGYVEGQNVIIQYRFASGHYDRLPAMAAELARNPIALFVTGSEPATLAAKAATATIPIVFEIGGDPIALGLVASVEATGAAARAASDSDRHCARRQPDQSCCDRSRFARLAGSGSEARAGPPCAERQQ